MKVLHVINRQSKTGPGLKNLSRSSTEKDVYHSGYWDLALAKAETLIGGMLFLHESKTRPSRFGRCVLSVESVRSEFARSHRVVFKERALAEGRGVWWRGANHAMASLGSIIDVPE